MIPNRKRHRDIVIGEKEMGLCVEARRLRMPPLGLQAYVLFRIKTEREGGVFQLSLEDWWGVWGKNDRWERREEVQIVRIDPTGPVSLGNLLLLDGGVPQALDGTVLLPKGDTEALQPDLDLSGVFYPPTDAKPVSGPWGRFASLKEAERETGRASSTIRRWCREARDGWHFVGESGSPPAQSADLVSEIRKQAQGLGLDDEAVDLYFAHARHFQDRGVAWRCSLADWWGMWQEGEKWKERDRMVLRLRYARGAARPGNLRISLRYRK